MADSRYCSIVDCALCRKLPLKLDLDLDLVEEIPKELKKLSTVLSFDLEPEHEYSSNTVELLKCPKCGTYYYFNHFVDEGEHFMDPTSNDVSIRRYPPLAVIRFLEGIINKIPGTFPQPLGKLRDAFLEDTYPYPNEISEKERREKLKIVIAELNEIKGRYRTVIEEFINIIRNHPPEWHLKKYIVDSLLMHFINEDDWSSISNLMLKHRDPIIRVEALKFLAGFCSGDAAVTDILHIPNDILEKLEKILTKKSQLDEIIQVASKLALSDHGHTYHYDGLFGKYYPHKVQYDALYCIRVLAEYAGVSKLIPQLVDLLSEEDESLNFEVCWTLKRISEQNKEDAKLILGAIKSKADSRIMRSQEVQELIKECSERE